jgi:hypothetical protein
LYVPQSIAVLAPGQEWRTAWESGIEIEEYDGELASNYVGRVDYNGTMNQAQPAYNNPISLDTNMFRDMHRISTERSRTVEKALYEISDTLKGYKRKHGGIWVYTVPGTEEQGYYEQLAESRRPRRDLT